MPTMRGRLLPLLTVGLMFLLACVETREEGGVV